MTEEDIKTSKKSQRNPKAAFTRSGNWLVNLVEVKRQESENSFPHTECVPSEAGYFTSKFHMSKESIKHISPAVIESLKAIAVNSRKPFTIADYGCADGGTSMPLMYACVKELRNLYGNELEIQINYEDRPENDYNSIFYLLQGSLPLSSSYLCDFPNVFVSATGTSFYEQCFPIQGERNLFTKQAEKDWEQFLLMRAKELAKGGRLALIIGCENEGETKDMEEMTIPEYFRTREELVEPFISDASPVRKAGLSLVSLELKEFPLPERAMWQVTGNAKTCARLMTEQTRAWSNSFFWSALGDHHSAEEKSMILDEFFHRLEEQVLLSPEEYMGVMRNAFIIIEKS